MKIIAITGMPGSGKKVMREEIEKRRIPVVVMRHVVEDEMRKKGIEPTNKALREYATDMRKRLGYDIVAKRSLEKARKLNAPVLIMDGIRGDMEVDFFRKQQDVEFVLIAVIASAETRFKRLSERGLEWDMKTREEFEYRDKKEISWGLDKAIEIADYKIENEGSVEEFKAKIDEVIKQII